MSQQRQNGDAHEYLCAKLLVDNGGNFVNTPTQKFQLQRRMRQHDLLKSNNSKTYQRILKMAIGSVNKLPKPIGDVVFTETDVNDGEVYDLLYDSVEGKIKLSCKTAATEDKAYRFSTQGYIFNELNKIHSTYFGNRRDAETYNETVSNNNLTISGYQKETIKTMSKITQLNTKDKETLIALTKNKVIGHGGYYKTTNKGEVLYYPKAPVDSTLKIDETSVTIKTANYFTYTATTYDIDNNPIADYEISFRVKFKDGRNKTGRFLDNIPKGFGATIRLKVLKTYKQANHQQI